MNDAFKKHGAFSWSELLVDDVDSAIKFYTDVIGWDIEEMDVPGVGRMCAISDKGGAVVSVITYEDTELIINSTYQSGL